MGPTVCDSKDLFPDTNGVGVHSSITRLQNRPVSGETEVKVRYWFNFPMITTGSHMTTTSYRALLTVQGWINCTVRYKPVFPVKTNVSPRWETTLFGTSEDRSELLSEPYLRPCARPPTTKTWLGRV